MSSQLPRLASTAMLLVHRTQRYVILAFGGLALLTQSASAQCPAFGNDTTCGVVITIVIPSTGGAAQASVSFTGQGPYDGSDDTLIGIVNNTSVPINSITLTSSNGAFGFDGDGINTYGAPGNSKDSTGYGGPNTYFTNVTGTSATANFIVPLAPNGGSTYFSLENSLGAATVCSSIINNSVPKPAGGGTGISTVFTPNSGNTLGQAAQLCGFTGWDWQQTVTSLPLPSPFIENGTTTPLFAPPPFNDPPPNDYTYSIPPSPAPLPLYYSPFSGISDPYSVVRNSTTSTLSFSDNVGDPCLFGGSGAGCGGKTAPAGKKIGFTTHLVGLVGLGPGYGIQDTGIGFSWTSNNNGTSGGVAVIRNNRPIDPGSGTGGVTVTNFNSTTTYQYPKSVGVSAINGVPVTTSNTAGSSLLGVGQIVTLASGLAYSRATQTFNGIVTITNVSSSAITGPFQIVLDSLTPGVTLVNATSTFGGWSYVTVPNVGSLQPGQSASVVVQFRDPANVAISFSPVPYSGSFN